MVSIFTLLAYCVMRISDAAGKAAESHTGVDGCRQGCPLECVVTSNG